MCDSFIIIFHRNLFSLVDSWRNFITFTFLSTALEFFMYQFSITAFYERLHDEIIVYAKQVKIDSNNSSILFKLLSLSVKIPVGDNNSSFIPSNRYNPFLCNLAYIYAVTQGWRDGKTFVHKNALDLSYRYVIRVTTTISYIIFQVFLRYGYNAPFYDPSSYSINDFNQLMIFIVISFLLETIAHIPANYWLIQRFNISLYSRFISFFHMSDNHEIYVHMLIWYVGHITSDVFVAKIDYNTANL